MSGFVGILNTGAAPVDRRLLCAMTDALRFRGPDAERSWIEGNAGLGHTQFATTDDASTERQPCTVDGKSWIAADARIDGREDLVLALGAAGHDAASANDAELILHAYAAWGERCAEHLLGDFAFVIWDTARRRLVCARDPFGIKPFFYAETTQTLVVSNTLDCVRVHPAVSDELNDLAIADFLLFTINQTADTTTYRDVRRLPGGHTLVWENGRMSVRRHWTLRRRNDIRYTRANEYVQHFNDVLTTAVRDRMRTRRVTVMMSGGLDSTSVAATARRLLSGDGEPFALHASTLVYDGLVPDRERHFSSVAADALRIPIDYVVGDECRPFDRWDHAELRSPEPTDEPFRALIQDVHRRLAAHGCVALTGFDGDTLMDEVPRWHFASLAASGRFLRLAQALATYSWTFHTAPHIGLRSVLKHYWGRKQPLQFPAWLNPDLTRDLHLRERWNEYTRPTTSVDRETLRPYAVQTLTSTSAMSFFERLDPAVSGLPLEFRHPLLDMRVIDYVLAIPAVPWCMRKTVLREAMRGILPEEVRTREKTPLAGHPLLEFLKNSDDVRRLDTIPAAPEFARYVDRSALPAIALQIPSDSVYLRLRPLSLNCWLHTAEPFPRGARHDRQLVHAG
jgi:asparagine synthase (glutamine-hydrolysing)